jgi:hypothetical protein
LRQPEHCDAICRLPDRWYNEGNGRRVREPFDGRYRRLTEPATSPTIVETNVNSETIRKTLLPLALLIVSLAACSDDDPVKPNTCVPPDTPIWKEVDLEGTAGDTRVMAVDFTGDHGLAVRLVIPDGGAAPGFTNEFFRLQPDGGWLKDDLGDIRSGFVAMDLALDTTGKCVLAGIQMSDPPSVVLDLRGPAAEYVEQSSYGMLTVDGEGSFMVAGGRSGGGGLWTSTGPGVWNFDDLPLTGTNDSGFHDVYIRGDRAVACGYDDGADTLQVILTRTATTDWEKIESAGSFGRTYYCIALSEDGAIFVGGIVGAGSMSPRAFLAQRSVDGLWTELILPDPELLHGVMDILIASDDSIYLACRGEGDHTMANLIHASPSGVLKKITAFPGGLLQVDQAADGNIYAVGFRRDESTGVEEGVMLVKTP